MKSFGRKGEVSSRTKDMAMGVNRSLRQHKIRFLRIWVKGNPIGVHHFSPVKAKMPINLRSAQNGGRGDNIALTASLYRHFGPRRRFYMASQGIQPRICEVVNQSSFGLTISIDVK